MDDGKVLSYYIEGIARVCHQANKAYCEMFDDFSQVDWDELTEEEKKFGINEVMWRIDNYDAPVSAQHDQWMIDKIADGWVYGDVKDVEKKTHPCLVPYEQLPMEQRYKDHLFVSIVKAIS